MEHVTDIQTFQASPLAGFVEFLSEWEKMKQRIAHLEAKIHVKRSDQVKAWYSIKDVARHLNVSERTVRRFLDRGLLQRCLASGKVLIPAESLKTFEMTTLSE